MSYSVFLPVQERSVTHSATQLINRLNRVDILSGCPLCQQVLNTMPHICCAYQINIHSVTSCLAKVISCLKPRTWQASVDGPRRPFSAPCLAGFQHSIHLSTERARLVSTLVHLQLQRWQLRVKLERCRMLCSKLGVLNVVRKQMARTI